MEHICKKEDSKDQNELSSLTHFKEVFLDFPDKTWGDDDENERPDPKKKPSSEVEEEDEMEKLANENETPFVKINNVVVDFPDKTWGDDDEYTKPDPKKKPSSEVEEEDEMEKLANENETPFVKINSIVVDFPDKTWGDHD